MKITDKPMLKSRFVRFLVVHYGRYSENEITKNGSSLQLPCEENQYSVSKIIFGLEIGNLVYAIAVFVLCGVYLTGKNTNIAIGALVLLAVYFIGLIISVVIYTVKTRKAEQLNWEKKYQGFIQSGFRNKVTLSEAESSVFEGKQVCFNLYGIDFMLDIYPRNIKEIELLDLTHQRILTVEKGLHEIMNAISINAQSLNLLWEHLNIEIKDSTFKEGI